MHGTIVDGTDETQQIRCVPWWLYMFKLNKFTIFYLLTFWNCQETYKNQSTPVRTTDIIVNIPN